MTLSLQQFPKDQFVNEVFQLHFPLTYRSSPSARGFFPDFHSKHFRLNNEKQPMAGMQADAGEGADQKKIVQYELAQDSELRCEAAWDSPVSIKLLSGTAEVFGTEIPQGQWLAFPSGEKFAVFTWHGARLEVEGHPEVIYTESETPMASYANVHAVLENRRREALQSAESSGPNAGLAPKQGPRVMLVGPTDSGKSSLARILLSYAARHGWRPLYVDLDIGQGSLGIPGTLGASPIEAPIDPTQGMPQDALMLFFYGHITPSVNPELYRQLVKELAAVVDRQMAGNRESGAAGMLINTMGWVEGLGYELLLHSISTLNVDVILVLGQERLLSMLQDKFRRQPRVEIVKLAKSGGVVTRSVKHRQKTRQNRMKDYFYGPAQELSPHASVARFDDLQVFRLGGGPQAPRSALPIGAVSQADPTRATPVTISKDLVHAVLGVSYAQDSSQILSSNVAGFICVKDVDVSRRMITYIAPSPGPLPTNILLAGTLSWAE